MAYPQEIFANTIVAPNTLLGKRRAAASNSMLLCQLQILKDTGRFDAFRLKWHSVYDKKSEYPPIRDHLFWDSDIGKWIEGACYFLQSGSTTDSTIDSAVKELVHMIRDAQEPDGYLNIHFQMVEPGRRFTNLRDMHELYNLGHLIEAALAHHQHYRNTLLLDPLLKYVSLLHKTFGLGEDQIHGYPGHPEIELALLRLHRRTGDKQAFELARYFIMERGNPAGSAGAHFFTSEAEKRGEDPTFQPAWWPAPQSYWYSQAHVPIVQQQSIEGHSVRAMYLLTAVADLVRQDADIPELKTALHRLWDNMVEKRMYVTGGIGAMKQWEGFGKDYFLPHSTDEGGCYAETCAAIGVMMLAQRLLQLDLNNKYSDIMELSLYNAVFTAMSIDCKKFTYVNQLASSDNHLSTRHEWFTCACCPPNVLRLLGMIGGYIWDVQEKPNNDTDTPSTHVNIHLYTSSSLSFSTPSGPATLTQETDWPRHGTVEFTLRTPSPSTHLHLRIPSWATSYTLTPPLPSPTLTTGYLHLPPSYLSASPAFTLRIPLPPRLIPPHPFHSHPSHTLARGPIIYCIEDPDNAAWARPHFHNLHIRPSCIADGRVEARVVPPAAGALDEAYVALHVSQGVYTPGPLSTGPQGAAGVDIAVFVPYYLRGNRGGEGWMRVGLK
ncbi:hypothetical protein ACN47E_003382 [Coniothyrium glycines]